MRKSIFLFLFSFFVTVNSFAQLATAGKNFFVAFGRNNAVDTLNFNDVKKKADLRLQISATASTAVTLSFTENSKLNTTINLAAGEIVDYTLTEAQVRAAYTSKHTYVNLPGFINLGKKSIEITSTNAPITVVAISMTNLMYEATGVFPVESLGKEYIHSGWDPYDVSSWSNHPHCDGYMLVATENNTKITQTFTNGYLTSTSLKPEGSITLNKGDVYLYVRSSIPDQAKNTGTRIVSDKPLAYFQSGTSIMDSQYKYSGANTENYSFEQIPPVEQWGKRFIVPAIVKDKQSGIKDPNDYYARVRVFAPTDGTQITVKYTNGIVENYSIPRNQFKEISFEAPISASYIESNNPVGVFYMSMPWRISTGWLPPVEQRTPSVYVSPPINSSTSLVITLNQEHYVNVVVPTSSKNSTMLTLDNDQPVLAQDAPNFKWIADNIGGSGYSYGRYFFGTGKNMLKSKAIIENPDGVITFAHSEGAFYGCYFYSAGLSARDLKKSYSISGRVHCSTHKIGIEKQKVNYTINGGAQYSVITDADGNYEILNVPSGANVIISPSKREGHTAEVLAIPSTSNVSENITGKDIIYANNPSLVEIYYLVPSCGPVTEIDILSRESRDGWSPNREDVSVEFLDNPKYAEKITGLNANKNFEYVPHTDFRGIDYARLLLYKTENDNKMLIDTIALYLNIIDCPDNVVSSDCKDTEIRPDSWGIQLRSKTRPSGFAANPGAADTDGKYIMETDVPLVGDIYGTGDVKILAAVTPDPSPDGIEISTEMAIFDGKTGECEKLITVAPFYSASGTRALAKVDESTKLFIASGTHSRQVNYLYCYDLKTGALCWQSDQPYTTTNDVAPNILIADMNADGTPEVIVRDKIYNASTGKLLLDMGTPAIAGFTYGYGAGHARCDGNGSSSLPIISRPYLPAVADMDNDGNLEFIAGNNIYRITIPENAQDASGSSVEVMLTAEAAPGGNMDNVGDGATVVTDLDRDGYLDVIVTRNTGIESDKSTGDPVVYAWNGKTGKMFGNAIILKEDDDPSTPVGLGPSIPFTGNLDQIRGPKVCVSTEGRLHILTFDFDGSKTLIPDAKFKTAGASGACTLSMFDFNSDGIMELVYHDNNKKYVLNYNNGTLVNLMEDCDMSIFYTASRNEFPVIADVTGDGRANIIALGSNTDGDAKLAKGYLYIYESLPGNEWAPTRTVWNQWAYNAVNVNRDLSIPRYQLNPATYFLGGCSTQPFNGFMKQHTTLDKLGCPVWLLPNVQWEEKPNIVYDNNSITVSGKIINLGSARMRTPFYITTYKNGIEENNEIQIKTISNDINPGETVDVSFTIDNVNNSDISTIIIGLNDKDGVSPYQQVCTPVEYEGLALSAFTVNGEDYISMDGKLFCNENEGKYEYVFKTSTISSAPPTSIVWKLNGEEIPDSKDMQEVKVNLPDGHYTLSMTIPSGVGESP